MDEHSVQQCTAFEGNRCIAAGDLVEVVKKAKAIIDRGGNTAILIFDDVSSELIEVDFRGAMEDVLARLCGQGAGGEQATLSCGEDQTARRGPGRPKLGVVSREVTLLPRHWDWLNSQPGGASVALRKLVEEARRVNAGRDKVRHAQEATFRFMSAMAGDMSGFEEATRALYARDQERFNRLVEPWPVDVRDHARKLAQAAWQ